MALQGFSVVVLLFLVILEKSKDTGKETWKLLEWVYVGFRVWDGISKP